MCTVNSETEIMVCDVSRQRVQETLLGRIGNAASFETVHGHGTRVICVDPGRTAEFQASIGEALGWSENGFNRPANG